MGNSSTRWMQKSRQSLFFRSSVPHFRSLALNFRSLALRARYRKERGTARCQVEVVSRSIYRSMIGRQSADSQPTSIDMSIDRSIDTAYCTHDPIFLVVEILNNNTSPKSLQTGQSSKQTTKIQHSNRMSQFHSQTFELKCIPPKIKPLHFVIFRFHTNPYKSSTVFV